MNSFAPRRALTRLLTRAREIWPDTAYRLCSSLKNFLERTWWCSATRMSERSIEMLFKEAYGISPRTWSQIARLNAARQDLLESDSAEVRVSDVAVRWGFFHFGRFSAAYRHLFGELPSTTAATRGRRPLV